MQRTMKSVLKLPQIVRFIWGHPLSRHRRFARLRRFVGWQVGARLVPGPVIVPFVDETRLIVRPGMQGATGNIYTGLHEFDDMAFVLHCLRKDDLFVDIGANVGTYTVLAAGVIGCHCISMEPVRSSFEQLIDNLRINEALPLVEAHRVAIGAACGTACMTDKLDTMNRVIAANGCTTVTYTSSVPMRTLDEIVGNREPAIIKIDVEGFESQVVAGGMHTLQQSSVLAVLMETNCNVGRGEDRESVSRQMDAWGFRRYRYHGLTRRLAPIDGSDRDDANTIFARSIDALRERIRDARRFRVLDVDI